MAQAALEILSAFGLLSVGQRPTIVLGAVRSIAHFGPGLGAATAMQPCCGSAYGGGRSGKGKRDEPG